MNIDNDYRQIDDESVIFLGASNVWGDFISYFLIILILIPKTFFENQKFWVHMSVIKINQY